MFSYMLEGRIRQGFHKLAHELQCSRPSLLPQTQRNVARYYSNQEEKTA